MSRPTRRPAEGVVLGLNDPSNAVKVAMTSPPIAFGQLLLGP